MVGPGWWVWATLLLAGPRTQIERSMGSFDRLEEALVGAGWTMTPERSATYAVGDVYSPAQNAPVAFGVDCFDATPREGAYTSLEVDTVDVVRAVAEVDMTAEGQGDGGNEGEGQAELHGAWLPGGSSRGWREKGLLEAGGDTLAPDVYFTP